MLGSSLGLGAGCGGTDGDSCEVSTDQMSAVAVVIDSGWDIRAAIDFEEGDRRGRGTPLRLCDSDALTIDGRRADPIDKADRIEYARTLDADADRRRPSNDQLDLLGCVAGGRSH